MNIVSEDFFHRPVLTVAPELLGKVLVMNDSATTLTPTLSLKREREIRGIITEVEAYDGVEDKACHGSRDCRGEPRRTERTKIMFGPAGHWYVYLCYGMYWMLNIVCERDGYPAAVLIRGIHLCHSERSRTITNVSPLDYARGDTRILNGPGRLTKHFGIDKGFNGKPAIKKSGLWIEDWGVVIPKGKIQRTPRIGVSYAGEWANKPYRFVM